MQLVEHGGHGIDKARRLAPDEREYGQQQDREGGEEKAEREQNRSTLRHAPVEKTAKQALQDERDDERSERRREHSAEPAHHEQANGNEHHEEQGFFVCKPMIQPATGELDDLHVVRTFRGRVRSL